MGHSNRPIAGQELLRRYQSGSCSATEQRLVESWLEHIRTEKAMPTEDRILKDLYQVHRDILANQTISTMRMPPRQKRMLRYASYAAAVLLLVLLSIFMLQRMVPRTPGGAEQDGERLLSGPAAWADFDRLEPVTAQATLTLSDGTLIPLDEASDGITLDQSGIHYLDGSILLSPPDDQQLVVRTPFGGMYRVVLADGSTVWLNAGSMLRYPARFSTGSPRLVELEGEAFFDIVPTVDDAPFMVKTAGQSVNVLGTQFNIHAYPGEEITTTLVEGRIQIAPAQGESLILAPNEQSLYRNHRLRRQTVDVYPFIVWKEDVFSFSGKSFRQVLNEIGRWYNLEIVYEGAVPDESFIGDAYRNEKLSVILKMLEGSSFDFRLQPTDRKLIIINKR